MFRLEDGKYYPTREGGVVLIKRVPGSNWKYLGSNGVPYSECGHYGYGSDGADHPLDIVATPLEDPTKETANNEVNHPTHYTQGGIECIDAIQAQLTPEELRGFLKGNVAKYLWRERGKQGNVSLEKAQWYLNKLIQETE